MTATCTVVDAPLAKTKGREVRTQSIATRFTPTEERQLLQRAEASRQNLREWARDVLLRAAVSDSEAEMAQHIFTELVGIQLLLMDTLEPLLRGDKISPDRVGPLFRQSQSVKTAKAQELLAKRREKKEK
jgi:hypothetical protein